MFLADPESNTKNTVTLDCSNKIFFAFLRRYVIDFSNFSPHYQFLLYVSAHVKQFQYRVTRALASSQ
jgi:hypothetical protein